MDAINIKIAFEQQEQKFLANVCSEVLGGGSTQVIQNILRHSYLEVVQQLSAKVRTQANAASPSIDLTAEEWRVLYESINAVIYGLGPSELPTCTGYNLPEVCAINLKICSAVWGAYAEGQW